MNVCIKMKLNNYNAGRHRIIMSDFFFKEGFGNFILPHSFDTYVPTSQFELPYDQTAIPHHNEKRWTDLELYDECFLHLEENS